MTDALEIIASKEYVGRMILMGMVDDKEVICYAITGRSPSSRARWLKEVGEGQIKTEPTDLSILETGIEPLLIYNCTKKVGDVLIVSNGGQTDVIADRLPGDTGFRPIEFLEWAFQMPKIVRGNDKIPFIDLMNYEPDEPNYTPRISGILTRNGAAMHIIKKSGDTASFFYHVNLENGKARVISTYTGQNVPSGEIIPSYINYPFEVTLKGSSPIDIGESVFEALGPKQPGQRIISPGQDFRVGVVTMFYDRKTDTLSKPYIIDVKGRR